MDLLALLPTVINTIDNVSQEIVLVLDDYHLVHLPELHRALEFLISHRPENFHVAIGSRSNPALPLARWRARGRLMELRTSDLRFTLEETRLFLSDVMQLNLVSEMINKLAEVVEGWPVGMQLVALSLSKQAKPEQAFSLFSGNQRSLAEFLMNEVVNQLPEDVQSFLLETSILERMCAQACDAILGIETSAALLAQLEQSNLFIIILNEGQSGVSGSPWYRYHHLFRDFLRSCLIEARPARSSELHRAAADWFSMHGWLYEGAAHAFQCGDWNYTAEYVEQHCFTLIVTSDIAAIYTWSATFPEKVIRKRPKLCVFQALALAYRFQAKYRRQVEARLRHVSQAMETLSSQEDTTEVQELTASVYTFLAMIPDPQVDALKQLHSAQTQLKAYSAGDPGCFPWLLIAGYAHLALNHPKEAQQSMDEALPLALQSGLFFGMVETTFHLVKLACSQGNLSRALQLCRSAQAEFSTLISQYNLALPALGCLEVAEGCILLEQDRLDDAEMLLQQGLERMGWGMNPYYLLEASLGLGRLYEIQGKLAQALECYKRLEVFWPDIQLIIQGYRVQTWLRCAPENRNALDAAHDWLQDYYTVLGNKLPVFGLGPLGAADTYYQSNLIWMRLQIQLGQPEVIQAHLESHLQVAQQMGLAGREIELILILAQMYCKQGQNSQALVAMERAVNLSRPRGYMRIFDQSFLLDELVLLAGQHGIGSTYLAQLLSAIRRTRGGRDRTDQSGEKLDALHVWAPSVELFDTLSQRELEVLRMIASGASNQAVANHLVITVGTVKSHIHHIFSKLNAHNRTEAVAKARKLGLIEKD